MEFGPRALGNRSILANPGHPDMKDILNKRVKFRESFRPFAAIVTEEDCAAFFDHDYPNPYMLLVYNVKPEQRSVLPAITHVDGTVRIQTVNEKENLPMRRLLKAFEKRSGFPVLINTSFNIKSEPIVCTPENAIQSFLASDIDFLVLGDMVVTKRAEKKINDKANHALSNAPSAEAVA
jgi:carbamoyltransferase